MISAAAARSRHLLGEEGPRDLCSAFGIVAALTLLSLLAGCGGGGGGGSVPPFAGLSFQSASISDSEGGAVAVPVELEILGGGTLPATVTFQVTATGGTATEGSDFSFSTSTLSFSGGNADGSTRLAVINFPTDALVEGTETITLSISILSGEAGLGTLATKSIGIVDANAATIDFTAASQTTPDETSAFYPFTVALDLAPGNTLATTLEVFVIDNGEGTATSGADYGVVGTRTITFAAGSADGATQSQNIVVTDDATAEGSETLHLQLVNSHPSVTLGTPSEHILTITDDDASGAGAVAITVGGSPVSSGATVNLGNQFSSLGPGATTTLTFENTGGTAVIAELPVLVSGDDREFLVEYASVSPLPAPTTSNLVAAPANPIPSPLIDVSDDPNLGVALIIDEIDLLALAGVERTTFTDVGLPGGARVDLTLERVPPPIAADAVLSIDGVHVPLDASWIEGVSFWRGRVVGEDGSHVFLSLSERSSLGWVRSTQVAGGLAYLFPEDLDPGASGGVDARWVVGEQLEAIGMLAPNIECEARSIPPTLPSGLPSTGSAAPPSTAGLAATPSADPSTSSLTQGTARLAIETDYQFFQLFGNTTDANNYVVQQIAAISDLYQQQIHTPLTIAYIGLHSNSNDGWTTQDPPTGTTGQLLDEFQAAWAPGFGGSGWPVSADLAHFISGASLGGGIAYVGALCNQNFGFGVSAVNGNINWSTFTGLPSSGNWDFIVVAHELGHNFNGDHTHEYCPPVDTCQSNCEGPGVCEPGTIMSYCHLCGGTANVSLEFHPFVANEMRKEVNDSCFNQTIIAPGETITYELRFDPDGAAGGRSAVLRFVHDGVGTNPFEVTLTGTAQ